MDKQGIQRAYEEIEADKRLLKRHEDVDDLNKAYKYRNSIKTIKDYQDDQNLNRKLDELGDKYEADAIRKEAQLKKAAEYSAILEERKKRKKRRAVFQTKLKPFSTGKTLEISPAEPQSGITPEKRKRTLEGLKKLYSQAEKAQDASFGPKDFEELYKLPLENYYKGLPEEHYYT